MCTVINNGCFVQTGHCKNTNKKFCDCEKCILNFASELKTSLCRVAALLLENYILKRNVCNKRSNISTFCLTNKQWSPQTSWKSFDWHLPLQLFYFFCNDKKFPRTAKSLHCFTSQHGKSSNDKLQPHRIASVRQFAFCSRYPLWNLVWWHATACEHHSFRYNERNA